MTGHEGIISVHKSTLSLSNLTKIGHCEKHAWKSCYYIARFYIPVIIFNRAMGCIDFR